MRQSIRSEQLLNASCKTKRYSCKLYLRFSSISRYIFALNLQDLKNVFPILFSSLSKSFLFDSSRDTGTVTPSLLSHSDVCCDVCSGSLSCWNTRRLLPTPGPLEDCKDDLLKFRSISGSSPFHLWCEDLLYRGRKATPNHDATSTMLHRW